MRLRSITLKNFRGVEESRVDFSPGVTVVEGPNEVGKSSIAESIRLLRDMKDSSKAGPIKSVKPVHRDEGPEAILEMSTGDYELTYRKRWLKRPLTELTVTAPAPEQLSSDQAHARFLAILAETIDVDLLEALELVQGRSLDQPKLADVSALHRALDDSDTQFESHDELMAALQQEYQQFFTPTGKPTGAYKRASDVLAEAVTRLEEMRGRLEDVDGLTERHRAALVNGKRIESRLAQAQEDLQQLQASGRQLDELRRTAASTQQRLDAARKDADAAVRRREDRTQLVAEATEREERLEVANSELEELDLHRGRTAAHLEEATTALRSADEARTVARDASKGIQAQWRNQQARAELAGLVGRLERAETATRERDAARTELSARAVDEAELNHLVTLETEVRVAESRRDATAPRVSVEALGDAVVLAGEETLGRGQGVELVARDELDIGIEGIIRVSVRPGTTPAELDQDLRGAQELLTAALEKAGVDSIAEARDVAETTREVRTRLERAETVLAEAGQGDSLEAMRRRRAELESRIDPDVETPRTDLEARAETARAEEEQAETDLVGAERLRDEARAGADSAQVAWVRASEAVKAAEAEHMRVAERLARERDLASEEELDADVAGTAGAVEHLTQRVRADQEAISALNPDEVDLRLSNAEALVERYGKELEGQTTEVHQLGALLDDRASQGLYDQLATAEARHDAARVEHARIERRAKAAELLWSTMSAKRDQAQHRYVAPFKAGIERLGSLVFGPGFAVEISSDLAIESRTLGGVTVPFEYLSSGAREQLSLLGRLACAQLIGSADGAPVILDDALGFADPDRLAALGAVVNRVGDSAQVILLTCQPDRYASIGGAEVVRLRPS